MPLTLQNLYIEFVSPFGGVGGGSSAFWSGHAPVYILRAADESGMHCLGIFFFFMAVSAVFFSLPMELDGRFRTMRLVTPMPFGRWGWGESFA